MILPLARMLESQNRFVARSQLRRRWRCLLHSQTRTFSNPESSRYFNLSPLVVESVIRNCPSDLLSLSFFIWSARQPNYFHDRRAFEHMVPTVRRLSDRFRNVSRIVTELERVGCSRKAQSFIALLRIYWYGGMYELALEVFDEMLLCGFVPNTFARNIILDILFRVGDFQRALNFFRDTCQRNFITFNIVLRNLCKHGDWFQARLLFREMVQSGFQPNSGTFLMVFHCFSKSHLMREALQLLGTMIVLGEVVSVTVWTMLVSGYFKAGEFDVVGELLDKMSLTGCSPNVVTYTSLIKGFYESQMVEQATNLLQVMHSKGCKPDLILYNILIHLCGKTGRFGEAVDLLYDLFQHNLKPDSYTLSSSLWVLSTSNNWDLPPLGLFLDVNISTESLDVVSCNSLLSFFRKAGCPFQAVVMFFYMIEKGIIPDNSTVAELLTSLCRSGRTQNAVNLYYCLFSGNFNILDCHIHTIIIDGLMAEKKINKALELFSLNLLEYHCFDVATFTSVIHGLMKGGRFLEALQIFELMKQVDVIPNNFTYDTMLYGFARACKMKVVELLLHEMKIHGVEMHHISFKTVHLLSHFLTVDLDFRFSESNGNVN